MVMKRPSEAPNRRMEISTALPSTLSKGKTSLPALPTADLSGGTRLDPIATLRTYSISPPTSAGIGEVVFALGSVLRPLFLR